MEIYSTVLNSGLSSLWVLSGRPVFFSFLQGKYIAFGSENKDIFYSDGSIAATTSSSLFQVSIDKLDLTILSNIKKKYGDKECEKKVQNFSFFYLEFRGN